MFPLLLRYLILLSYALLAILTPRLDAFDSAGTRFLALALLNLGAFSFLLSRKEYHPANRIFSAFMTNLTGVIYTLFLLINLLAFSKAVNVAESLVAFSKLFTIFTAVLIVSTILRKHHDMLPWLALAMVLLLWYDSATVFYQMYELLEKHPKFTELYAAFIGEVKTSYSNKNILASAIFVKLPFALYLWTFKKGLWHLPGLLGVFAGMMALMPLSTRAFYIGLALLAFFYLLFLFIRFLVDHRRWKTVIVSLTIIGLIPLLIYGGWRGLTHYFPEAGMFNLRDQVSQRLTTIKQDLSVGTRISSWNRSLSLIREEPALGVGPGNWTIRVMKYESKAIADYNYYYYNHNDFLQITAETGIVGGTLFILLFLSLAWAFLYALFKGSSSEMRFDQLFIPAFGLLCYSVDAFFNFPYDRPEIQSIWAIIVGIGIAMTPESKILKRGIDKIKLLHKKFKSQNLHINPIINPSNQSNSPSNQSNSSSNPSNWSATHVFMGLSSHFTRNLVPLLWLIMILLSGWLLLLNFRSLTTQAIVKYEVNQGKLTAPADFIIARFPSIPTLSIEGEPISVLKTRYLLNERRYDEAIATLKANNPSPWETRREFFLSLAYQEAGNTDSAIIYSKKVFGQKPLYRENTERLVRMLENRELYDEGANILEQYREMYRTMVSDPGETYVNWQADLRRKAAIGRVEEYYYFAMLRFNDKQYRDAAGYFSKIIEKEPGLNEAWEKRALCYFYLCEFKKCRADLDHLTAKGVKNPTLDDLQTKMKGKD